MTPDAKQHLSKTIRALRGDLLDDLEAALVSRYRLKLRAHEAELAGERAAERERLEEWLDEQVRAEEQSGGSREREHFIAQVVKEAAYTWLNRLVVLRLMEAAELMGPAVLTGGWDSPGYKEWREWAPALLDDDTQGFRTLLELVFDELAWDLPGLFGDMGVAGLVPMPPATLRATVEALDDPALASCWGDDTTLGWVYQYWNDPEREELDAKLNSGGKVAPHEVASKTQLFTERYMVEWLLQNSLGQMWLAMCDKHGWEPEVRQHGVLDALEERRADWRDKRENGEVELDALMPIESDVEERWKYWVPQPMPDEAVETAPDSVREIELLDPACGSGHFLVIAFDLLFHLYREESRHRGESWSDEEIVDSILSNNLHGIDIDPRAVQIAAAALYLKARTELPDYRPTTLNLVAPDLPIARLADDDPTLVEFREAVFAETGIPAELTDQILDALEEAYHLGSLLKIDQAIEDALAEYDNDTQGDLFTQSASSPDPLPSSPTSPTSPTPPSLGDETSATTAILKRLETFLAAHTSADDLGLRLHGEQLAAGIRFLRMNREDKFDLVVANPPYSGSSNLDEASYIKKTYPRGKADLFAAFLERGLQLVREGGASAMVTMRNWMFIKTYEDLRAQLTTAHDLRTLNDLGTGAFAEIGGHVVSTALSIVDRLADVHEHGVALQSDDTEGTSSNRTQRKRAGVLAQVGRHEFDVQKLAEIEGQPLVYWWDKHFLKRYLRSPTLGDMCPVRQGVGTRDNSRYVRKPWEISHARMMTELHSPATSSSWDGSHWVPFVMGAGGSEWFEPLTYVVNWQSKGLEIATFEKSKFGRGADLYFLPGVAINVIGRDFSARAHRFSSIISDAGVSAFPQNWRTALCFMNSKFARFVLESINPSVNFKIYDVNRLPIDHVDDGDIVFDQILDAFSEKEAARETSVEFKKPGPSCWEYAQDWAQTAVDREEGAPLPEWDPEYEAASGEQWLSWAVGVALGRFDAAGERGWLDAADLSEAEHDALPDGILYVSATEGPDSLDQDACALLEEKWREWGDEVGRNKDDLDSWLREKFFKQVHRQMYDNAPIYFPLSSSDYHFVAHVNIHRWGPDTLRVLLADYLVPERNRLEDLIGDIRRSLDGGESSTDLEARLEQAQAWVEELEQFIGEVEQCAEKGPPSTGKDCPEREVDARYNPVLDDGTMINAAGLWPLLDVQWKKPSKWWYELAAQDGPWGKHFDWSMLAARYYPERVDAKCKEDPSLAVAHGTFWQYHPARAYEWELRLQDEIHPNFTIDEDASDTARQAFFDEHPDKVEDIRADELKRRERDADEAAEVLPVVAPEAHPGRDSVIE